MGPALVLGGLMAACLLLLGTTMRRTGRVSRRLAPPYREALPWVAAGIVLVGAVLAVLPAVPPLVAAGLVTYAAVAVTATWRMATLDRASPWMAPSRRIARLVVAALGLTWLGLVLGLLLRIADLVAAAGWAS